eukprot:PRCOL_00002651-RA
MGDDGGPRKKRVAERQLTKDDGAERDSDGERESDTGGEGGWEKASEEELARRKIVRAKRPAKLAGATLPMPAPISKPGSGAGAPVNPFAASKFASAAGASNPFAALRPPTAVAAGAGATAGAGAGASASGATAPAPANPFAALGASGKIGIGGSSGIGGGFPVPLFGAPAAGAAAGAAAAAPGTSKETAEGDKKGGGAALSVASGFVSPGALKPTLSKTAGPAAIRGPAGSGASDQKEEAAEAFKTPVGEPSNATVEPVERPAGDGAVSSAPAQDAAATAVEPAATAPKPAAATIVTAATANTTCGAGGGGGSAAFGGITGGGLAAAATGGNAFERQSQLPNAFSGEKQQQQHSGGAGTVAGPSAVPSAGLAGATSVETGDSHPSLDSRFGQNKGNPVALYTTSANNSTAAATIGGGIGGGASGISRFSEGPQQIVTGEESERVLLAVDAALFEFKDARWNTRALNGNMRLNIDTDGQARLVMRAKGSGKLLLNANLWPEMTVSKMEGRGVTFAVVNHAGVTSGVAQAGGEGNSKSEDLCTYAVRLREQGKAELLFQLLEENKKNVRQGEATANEEPTVVKGGQGEGEGAAEKDIEAGVGSGGDKPKSKGMVQVVHKESGDEGEGKDAHAAASEKPGGE